MAFSGPERNGFARALDQGRAHRRSVLTERIAATVVINAGLGALAIGVGARLWRRPRHGDAGRALALFALWWMALGADAIVNATTWLVGALDADSAGLTAALTYAAVVCVVLMTWGPRTSHQCQNAGT